MYTCLHVKYHLFSSDCNKLTLSRQILRKSSYETSWKPVQWEPSCFLRNKWQTDMTTLIVFFFRNYMTASKNTAFIPIILSEMVQNLFVRNDQAPGIYSTPCISEYKHGMRYNIYEKCLIGIMTVKLQGGWRYRARWLLLSAEGLKYETNWTHWGFSAAVIQGYSKWLSGF